MSQSPASLEEDLPRFDSTVAVVEAATRGTRETRHTRSSDGCNRQGADEIVIEPQRGWLAIDRRELWRHRELLYFLVWRDVKVRYKQTVLGVAWAVLVPVLSMLVFTAIFGNFAGLKDTLPEGLRKRISGLCLCRPVALAILLKCDLIGWACRW